MDVLLGCVIKAKEDAWISKRDLAPHIVLYQRYLFFSTNLLTYLHFLNLFYSQSTYYLLFLMVFSYALVVLLQQ